ncbi:MAG: DUF669 domain-containing protein [Phycisphaerae bacterium]|nr:DUF669 domain-containing protein [Planctomycetia bacterium]MCL4719391.1 DUF669 domain-containing protein [Phycisphaerae bacterium]
MPSLNGFDAQNVDPNFSFPPIPAAKYLAAITESQMKPTKAGGAQYLQITFQLLEGEHKGRTLWARLNLDNVNPTTVKIARAELSAICRAVGVMAPKDSIELHNIPVVITVGLKKRKDNGEMANVITGYERRDAAAPRPMPTAANGKPPWQR